MVQQWWRAEDLERGKVVLFVWRVEKDHVPAVGGARRGLLQKLSYFRTEQVAFFVGNSAQLEVRFDQLATSPRTIDKRRVRCATRQRFDPDGARTRAEIEIARLRHVCEDDVEERLAQAVGRRSHLHRSRALQVSALKLSRNDAHKKLRLPAKNKSGTGQRPRRGSGGGGPPSPPLLFFLLPCHRVGVETPSS